MHACDEGNVVSVWRAGFPVKTGNEGRWEGASRLEATVLLFFLSQKSVRIKACPPTPFKLLVLCCSELTI